MSERHGTDRPEPPQQTAPEMPAASAPAASGGPLHMVAGAQAAAGTQVGAGAQMAKGAQAAAGGQAGSVPRNAAVPRAGASRPGAVLPPMDRRLRILTLCLGAVACIGPLAIDMYLPAMPAMAADLGAAEGEIELSIMGFFLGFCGGQLVFGPLSDRIGRKPVIFIGLGLFAVASLGCLLSASVPQLTLWRIVQGVGGSIGMVITISSVRDLFSGPQAARMMGFIASIFGIAPIVAPLLGGLIVEAGSWRIIFVFLACFALAVIVLVALVMPETRSPEMRAASRPSEALWQYGRLLRDRHYIPFAAASAFAQGGLFAYIAGAPFVLMELYGFSPMQFSLLFGSNALGMVIAAQFGGRTVARFGAVRTAQAAISFRAAAGIALLVLHLAGALPLSVMCTLFFFYIVTHGLIMPASNILALDRQKAVAGTAAALSGAMGFGTGAAASALLSLMADGTALPAFLMLAGLATVAAVISLVFFSRAAAD